MLWYSISPTTSVLVGPEVADTSGLERTLPLELWS